MINASFAAAGTADPVLACRAKAELAEIENIGVLHVGRLAVVPWQLEEPIGRTRLGRLASSLVTSEERPIS